MNSGMVFLNDKLSSLLIEQSLSPGSFEYKDAYKYFEDVYNTSKLIISNMVINTELGSKKGTVNVQPTFQIAKSVDTDKTSYTLTFGYGGDYYEATVDSSNKNTVAVAALV